MRDFFDMIVRASAKVAYDPGLYSAILEHREAVSALTQARQGPDRLLLFHGSGGDRPGLRVCGCGRWDFPTNKSIRPASPDLIRRIS